MLKKSLKLQNAYVKHSTNTPNLKWNNELSKENNILEDKIYKNLRDIINYKNNNVDVGTTYLLTTLNSSEDEILKSILDLDNIGVKTLRFSFPQVFSLKILIFDHISPRP